MEKAFMGISIRNPFYTKKENILKAIDLAKDYDEFLIFVVDIPYRLSLRAFKNLSEEQALSIALKEGSDLINFLNNISKKFTDVKVISWKELEDDNYKRFLIKAKKLEKKDPKFSGLLEREFTGAVLDKLSGNESKEKEKLCKDFIIEEVAMFSSLSYRDYNTRISKYTRAKSIDYFLKTKNLFLNHIQIK